MNKLILVIRSGQAIALPFSEELLDELLTANVCNHDRFTGTVKKTVEGITIQIVSEEAFNSALEASELPLNAPECNQAIGDTDITD